MDQSAKVIIFTMAYNAQNTIGRTIESILKQTYMNFQYYILDNAAEDKTEEIILEYCKKDKRIVPIHVNTNDSTNGGAFFHTLVNSSDADYIVWCDADDCYVETFLEETVRFAEDNHLDMVACGYDKVDGNTGGIIKRKELGKNLILHDELFVDEFIKYRGFMIYMWGKLYSIPYLRKAGITGTVRKERICNDTIWMAGLFREAERVGIYGKPVYQYYQYPYSLSNINIEASIDSYWDLWDVTKKYIESYGPVSKLNEDFLHAIHLSLVEEIVEKIFACESDTDNRLSMLYQVFSRKEWRETLERDADPQFNNLAARGQYVSGIKQRILALPDVEKYEQKKQQLLCCLEGR